MSWKREKEKRRSDQSSVANVKAESEKAQSCLRFAPADVGKRISRERETSIMIKNYWCREREM
jgi:hypothetical protein